jgi:hypothetical protein
MASQNRAAAQRRLEAEQAQRAVDTFGLPREIDPHAALIEELCRTAGHVAWLQRRLAGSADSDLVQFNPVTGERPSAWVEMYHRERAHYERVATAAIRAGIAERTIRVTEAQAQQTVNVLHGVLTDLNLTAAQQAAVPQIVERHLLELAA